MFKFLKQCALSLMVLLPMAALAVDFDISPDGKHLSMLKPGPSTMNVFVQAFSNERLPTGPVKQLTFVSNKDVSDYLWKGNETIVFLRDFHGDGNDHLFSVNIETGKELDLTPFKGVRVALVDDLKEVSESEVIIQMNKRDDAVFDVYRLNTATGDLKLVAQNPGKVAAWATDHLGKVRIAVERDALNTKIHSRPTEDEPFKEILSFDNKTKVEPLFFTFDNKNIYASSNLNRDKSAIVLLDPNTGAELKVIYQRDDVDVRDLRYSSKRKVITDASYVNLKPEHKFFDTFSEKRYNKIKSKLGDYQFGYSGSNKDENLFIVSASNDKTQGRYYLFDEKNSRLVFLGE